MRKLLAEVRWLQAEAAASLHAAAPPPPEPSSPSRPDARRGSEVRPYRTLASELDFDGAADGGDRAVQSGCRGADADAEGGAASGAGGGEGSPRTPARGASGAGTEERAVAGAVAEGGVAMGGAVGGGAAEGGGEADVEVDAFPRRAAAFLEVVAGQDAQLEQQVEATTGAMIEAARYFALQPTELEGAHCRSRAGGYAPLARSRVPCTNYYYPTPNLCLGLGLGLGLTPTFMHAHGPPTPSHPAPRPHPAPHLHLRQVSTACACSTPFG